MNNNHKKIVVRQLPSSLSEETFSGLITLYRQQITNFIYYPGYRKASNVEIASRASITFQNHAALLKFSAEFDGHVFVGENGSKFTCQVEYAPFQEKPRKFSHRDQGDSQTIVDPIHNTIDNNPDFLNFLQTLNNPVKSEEKPQETFTDNETTLLIEQVNNRLKRLESDDEKNKSSEDKSSKVNSSNNKKNKTESKKRKRIKKKRAGNENPSKVSSVEVDKTNREQQMKSSIAHQQQN